MTSKSHFTDSARFLAAAALALVAFTGSAEAQTGSCFPTCRTGFACSPSNQCVSICNPPCGAGQLCTAQATCVADPSAAPQQQPYAQQPYAQPQPQQQQAYGQPQPYAQPQPQQPLGPSEPSLLASPGTFRVSLALHLGFAGEASSHFDGDEIGAGDLATTFGFHLRGLAALGDYFLVGPGLSYRSYAPDVDARAPDPDRLGYFSIGAVFGAHFGLDLGSIAIDPYVLLGLGLAIVLPSDDLGIEDPELGVDFALRMGANVWFSETFGATASLGYQRADVFIDVPRASDSIRLSVGQFALELGVSLRLGS